ncbi:MAG: tRNA glutamyl-Q(34) synthetase GluQRS [Bauldia sp.]
MPPVFRFAPSPNGELHLGHAYSALLDFSLCRRAGGRFLLRIEDIDRVRCRPEYEGLIFEDLKWLGLSWEEPVRRQSQRMTAYAAALDRLSAMALVYPSFMSRAEIEAAVAGRDWPADPDGTPLYPAADRDLDAADARARVASGAAYALRLRMDRAIVLVGRLAWKEEGSGPGGETGVVTADPAAWGDVVIARKEAPTSYHLAVVVDDADQGVTHVVRCRDLFDATSVHVLLQCLLGLPAPAYHHHRLILDSTGRKLSKSSRDTALGSLRQGGRTPEDIRRMVGLV